MSNATKPQPRLSPPPDVGPGSVVPEILKYTLIPENTHISTRLTRVASPTIRSANTAAAVPSTGTGVGTVCYRGNTHRGRGRATAAI